MYIYYMYVYSDILANGKTNEEYFLLKGCCLFSTKASHPENKKKLEEMLQKEWDKVR